MDSNVIVKNKYLSDKVPRLLVDSIRPILEANDYKHIVYNTNYNGTYLHRLQKYYGEYYVNIFIHPGIYKNNLPSEKVKISFAVCFGSSNVSKIYNSIIKKKVDIENSIFSFNDLSYFYDNGNKNNTFIVENLNFIEIIGFFPNFLSEYISPFIIENASLDKILGLIQKILIRDKKFLKLLQKSKNKKFIKSELDPDSYFCLYINFIILLALCKKDDLKKKIQEFDKIFRGNHFIMRLDTYNEIFENIEKIINV